MDKTLIGKTNKFKTNLKYFPSMSQEKNITMLSAIARVYPAALLPTKNQAAVQPQSMGNMVPVMHCAEAEQR